MSSQDFAVMLFGSAARGDWRPGSDVDVLLAVEETRTIEIAPTLASVRRAFGNACAVTMHSFADLQQAMLGGSVFLLHLQLEGRLLHDPGFRLGRILSGRNCIDPEGERTRLRAESETLWTPDLHLRAPVVWRVARHLLRRAAFLECAVRGRPCFATHTVARTLEIPALPLLLDSRCEIDPPIREMRGMLAALVGQPRQDRRLHEL